jgi:hypothetical protein
MLTCDDQEHVAIYNEAYIPLMGRKHPEMMGKRYQDAWAELWDSVAELFVKGSSSARAAKKDDDCKLLVRRTRDRADCSLSCIKGLLGR